MTVCESSSRVSSPPGPRDVEEGRGEQGVRGEEGWRRMPLRVGVVMKACKRYEARKSQCQDERI